MIMEERHLQAEQDKAKREALILAKEKKAREDRERDMIWEEVKYLTCKRLCTMDPNCQRYQVHALKPYVCRECGHSSAYHTIVVDEEKDNDGKNEQRGHKAEIKTSYGVQSTYADSPKP